jgi:hypothetical protein
MPATIPPTTAHEGSPIAPEIAETRAKKKPLPQKPESTIARSGFQPSLDKKRRHRPKRQRFDHYHHTNPDPNHRQF